MPVSPESDTCEGRPVEVPLGLGAREQSRTSRDHGWCKGELLAVQSEHVSMGVHDVGLVLAVRLQILHALLVVLDERVRVKKDLRVGRDHRVLVIEQLLRVLDLVEHAFNGCLQLLHFALNFFDGHLDVRLGPDAHLI